MSSTDLSKASTTTTTTTTTTNNNDGMYSLTPDTILVRAPDLTIHLADDDEVRIDVRGAELFVSALALSILDVFAQPRPVSACYERLATLGPEQLIEVSSVVSMLARAGVLCRPEERAQAKTFGFVDPSIHVKMLEDRARTGSLGAALSAMVREDDIVIDIGAGTGVLSTFAALAGARRVYAIESTAIAEVAEKVFVANGVADRVTLIRGRSTHIELPERGTLLVTETIGNDPLDEWLLEIISDARTRLLVPDARVIPADIELFAVPVDIPRDILEQSAFTPERLEAWRTMYKIDFSPLASHRRSPSQPMMITTYEGRDWPIVASPIRLTKIDFSNAPVPTSLEASASFTLRDDTSRLGMIVAFRATLAPGIVLSTLPKEVDSTNCWLWPLWPAFDCLQNARGREVTVSFTYSRGMSALTTTCA